MHDSRPTIVVAILAAAALVVAVLVGAAPASAATFAPLGDTYVDASKPTQSFGTSNAMRVDTSPTRMAYLRFDVQGVGPVSSALLKVFAETSSSAGLTLRSVANSSWTETAVTYNNAPGVGSVIAQSGPVTSGTWVTFNVASVVTGDGPVAFALTTSSSSAIRVASKESANDPQLIAPAPTPVTYFDVAPSGAGAYTATSVPPGMTYTGTLKFAVESAVTEMDAIGGGTVHFTAGVFDYGSEYFEIDEIANITFDGEGVDVTTIRNSNSSALDTEPFDFSGADNVRITDMTIFAGGAGRSTSDAIDFDRGNNSVVENVKISGSRGRGIVFDGKNAGWTAVGNRVTNCVIVGVPSDGIELLASSFNRIEGCTITDVGGHGIQMTKSSTIADQPNKKSSNNVVTGNTITNSGMDGINVNSSDSNLITGNTLLNNSNLTSSRDGIRVGSADGITCDGNEVRGNTATDNQTPKTQTYGLRIASPLCNATVVADNALSGNKTGDLLDQGTGTIIQSNDSQPPTVPTGLAATSVTATLVALQWTASTDNVAVTGYNVYRDGAVVGTVGGSTTTFTDTTVAPATTYVYKVNAFDAAGNDSAQSDGLSVTTSPGGGPGDDRVHPGRGHVRRRRRARRQLRHLGDAASRRESRPSQLPAVQRDRSQRDDHEREAAHLREQRVERGARRA